MENKQTAFTIRVPASLIEGIEQDDAYRGMSRNSIANKALHNLQIELDGPTRKEAMLGRLERIESMLGMLMLISWDAKHVESVIKLTAEDIEAYRQNMAALQTVIQGDGND